MHVHRFSAAVLCILSWTVLLDLASSLDATDESLFMNTAAAPNKQAIEFRKDGLANRGGVYGGDVSDNDTIMFFMPPQRIDVEEDRDVVVKVTFATPANRTITHGLPDRPRTHLEHAQEAAPAAPGLLVQISLHAPRAYTGTLSRAAGQNIGFSAPRGGFAHRGTTKTLLTQVLLRRLHTTKAPVGETERWPMVSVCFFWRTLSCVSACSCSPAHLAGPLATSGHSSLMATSLSASQ
ncbi:hypothetical protein V5799_016863 [Amblyomma americanum]|uniref:Secreted protein n=1 Tax=Amblyomma americanum TaxID=6943 RepID=A0AAQ4F4Z2_AMBAM